MAAQRSLTWWDWTLMALLVGSVALMFYYETVDDPAQRRALEWLDLGLVVLFFGEWVGRVAKAPAKGRYAAAHSWELLGMIPLLAPVPGFLRFLRLFRLARILRLFGRLGEVLGTWERIAKESSILKIGAVAGSITLGGALLVWALERSAADTKIPDFETAIWWAIVTVTTVGYGDVTPVTSTGKFVAAILMVTGIGTIGLLASSVASVLVVDKAEDEGVDTASAPPVTAGRFVHELQTLVALHDSGKLDNEEFGRAKDRLLR